jgi:hypothetical protein
MIRRHSISCAALLVGVALATSARAQGPYRYEYAAKMLCGTLDTMVSRLVPQRYATAINVHNPSDSLTAIFLKKLGLTVPPGREQPGKVVRIALDTLRPDQALAVDCLDLQHPAGPSFEGFVVLLSPLSLDVSAVYTVPGGIDVEQIRSRIMR